GEQPNRHLSPHADRWQLTSTCVRVTELPRVITHMANEEHLPIRVPDVLFQYCSTSAIDIFDKRRIKSSTPSTLNDPFEWKPVVAEQATADQIWKAVTTTHNRAPLLKRRLASQLQG